MTSTAPLSTVEERLGSVLDGIGEGWVHAIDIDRGIEVGVGSDHPVVTASTFKVFVLLEVVLQAAEGKLSLTDRVRVPADRRTMGPTGLSVMRDDIDISVRDLAFWMMCVSDNTATDVLQELVGTDNVNARLASLGLTVSYVQDDCHALLSTFVEDLGIPPGGNLRNVELTPELAARNRALNAATTNRTTPREITDLLARIWRDEAGPPDAMAEVRRIMALQVWPHRLQAGFEEGIAVSGKTGTLLGGIRNETGVVEYPDGGRYAVAVYLRARRPESRQIETDLAIGSLARIAVDALRQT